MHEDRRTDITKITIGDNLLHEDRRTDITKITIGDNLLHEDRRTDITKITIAFRNFATAPKNKNFGKSFVPLSTGKYQAKFANRKLQTSQ